MLVPVAVTKRHQTYSYFAAAPVREQLAFVQGPKMDQIHW